MKSPKKGFFHTLKKIILISCYLGLITTIGVIGFLYHLSQNLPSLEELANPTYDLPSQIFDRHNNLITEFYTKRRVLIPIEEVPPVMIKALLAIEDNRFYHHLGVDPPRMIRALIIDIMEGGWVQGASTLTQQTAKMFLLTPDRKLIRKLKEILLAFKIESRFSKNQILELYLNKAYFGHGAYGIEAAAQTYFDKNTSDLNLKEAALLAGLPQAPSKLAPTTNMKRATRRRNLVLRKMRQLGYISKKQEVKSASSPIKLNTEKILHYNEVSYYVEHVRKYIYNKYGEDKLYRGGLKVYTEMDLAMQIYAQNALHQGLLEHDKRQGYRGPKENLLEEAAQEVALADFKHKEETPTSAQYKLLKKQRYKQILAAFEQKIKDATEENHFIIGGNILGVVVKVNKRTLSLDMGLRKGGLFLDAGVIWARPVNYKTAFSGGTRLRDFRHILKRGDVIELKILDYNQENNSFVLALTQKPAANGGIIVMNPNDGRALAMAGGFDFRESEFNRAVQGKRQTGSAFKPIVYSLALETSFTASSMLEDAPFVKGQYKPKNYSKKFQGNISLREALSKSKNTPSLRLGEELTTEEVIKHARKLGIKGEMPEDDITIVLGSASITLAELAATYSIFANGGYLIKPTFIRRIENRNGKILEDNYQNSPELVLSPQTAFIITSILRDVVERGTGWRAKAIHRPSAGKTGTTNNYTDAWYVGYIPQLITGVYVGFDKEQSTLGNHETGSRAAAPIWVDFMKRAIASMPILPFRQPPGINFVKINPESGLLDCQGDKKARFEYYKAGSEPKQCHQEDEGEGAKDYGKNYDDEVL